MLSFRKLCSLETSQYLTYKANIVERSNSFSADRLLLYIAVVVVVLRMYLMQCDRVDVINATL